MMKAIKPLVMVLVLCCFCFGQTVMDFRKRPVLTPYPKKMKEQLKSDASGQTFSRSAGQESVMAYTFITLKEESSVAALELDYTATPGANGYITFNFNKKDGGNGSAGRAQLKLPDAPEGGVFKAMVDVPARAAMAQLIFGGNGGIFSITLRSFKYGIISDNVEIPVKPAEMVPLSMPETWHSAAKLSCFYQVETGNYARAQTDVSLLFDNQALYLGFIAYDDNMQGLKAAYTPDKHDSPLWVDDCLEIFIFDQNRSLGWHYIVNPKGARFDGEVSQRVPGDPYNTNGKWNGEWEAKAVINKNDWQASLVIPWKTMGYNEPPAKLSVNFARERKSIEENSQWNAYLGKFSQVDKYGTLDLAGRKITRQRKMEKTSYLINRPKKFAELLGDEPGNYLTATWGACHTISGLPEAIRAKYSKEEAQLWIREMMDARGDAGMMGPFLPWVCFSKGLGWTKMEELFTRFGTKYPYSLSSSAAHASAVKNGAKLVSYQDKKSVDPASDEYRDVLLGYFEGLKKNPEQLERYRKLTGVVFTIDEPTNGIQNIYSKTRNAGVIEELEKVEAEILATTGFGKYGLADYFETTPSPDAPFRRIAFWRYWNKRMAATLKAVYDKSHETLPGVPVKGVDRNTVSGICTLDMAQIAPACDWVCCDPYPTSTSANYGMSRALYHTGFSAKVTGDLSVGADLAVTPQDFIYHGGKPSPDEMREWASQAMKVGAQILFWYTENSDTLMNMWDGHCESLSINKQLKTLRKIRVPAETRTAVLYSDYDRWGLNDSSVHAAYSVYAVLGEQLKTWFKFVSPTGLQNGRHSLKGIRLLYLPRMRYADSVTVAALCDFAEKGGTLVSFDPDLWRWNINGEAIPARLKLLEEELVPKKIKEPFLTFGSVKLPVVKVSNLPLLPENESIKAYDFAKLPANAKVLASYSDGKPAIVEIPFGKGAVIFSAVMPFGNSDAALDKDAGWKQFCARFAKQVSEPVNLPIWDFYLERKPENNVVPKVPIKW